MSPMDSTPARSVLILGANGRLGQAATLAFARAGWRVHAQFRRPPARTLPDGVVAVVVPLTDTAGIVAAAGDTDVVVSALSPSQYTLAAWQREAPALTQSAIDIAAALDATLLWPGSVYSYGQTMPEVLTEDTPHRPDTPFGRIRQTLETMLQQAAETTGPRCAVIRAGDFYGVGQGSWVDLVMLKAIRKHRLTLLADPDVIHAWAYLPDLAECFVRVAAQRARLPPFTTLHFAGHSVSGHDWRKALDTGQGLRVSQFPWLLTRLGGLVVPMLAALGQQRYLWQRPHRLDGTRLAALIGPPPDTPFATAARDSASQLGWSPNSLHT